MGLLEGKVALVTGGAGIIGSDTARLLAEEGARVVLADVPSSPVEEVAEKLRSDGHEVVAHPGDLTDEEMVIDLVAATVQAFGRLDVVDNNAGATYLANRDGDLLGTTLDLWHESTAVNLTAPMLVSKHAVPVMIEGGGGSIVNISSGQSLRGDLRNTAYAAGKGGLNALTRHIAVQYGPQRIRCNAIAPGLIVSDDRLPQFPDDVRTMFESNCSIQRLGRPRDISNAVLYLASELSAYVTGQVITVDGGITDQLSMVGAARATSLGAFSTKD